MTVDPTMRVNEYGRPASAPPTYRYSNFFNSFTTDLNLNPELTFTAPTSNCSTPISEEFGRSRSSLESAASYPFSVRTFAYGRNGGLKRSFSSLTSTMKGRTLSLRFRRGRTTTANSMNSLPTTISTTASTLSGRSKRLFAKFPKMFEFELPFGALRIHRISKVPTVGHGLLTKRHKKPSTLDFRCIGMTGEDDFYFGGTPTNICAPRIHWVKPDIHSDWKKDWFMGVC
ncbi:hypothetical protein BGX38DRAFT_603688 [Terfezia claveryi]|nr:hypothetical protein BGX38DRAFT_603688 [Terfezia claveryi]